MRIDYLYSPQYTGLVTAALADGNNLAVAKIIRFIKPILFAVMLE